MLMCAAGTWTSDLTEQRRFKALIEQISDVLCLLDGNGILTYISPAVFAVLGYLPEERIGRSAFELLHHEYRLNAEQIAAASLESPGQEHHFEGWVRHRDGTWRWI